MKLAIEESVLRQALNALQEAAEPEATQAKADLGMCAQWDVDVVPLITALRTAIEQMEKVEPVYQIRPECENWIDCTREYFLLWKSEKRKLYTHPAPAVPEVKK